LIALWAADSAHWGVESVTPNDDCQKLDDPDRQFILHWMIEAPCNTSEVLERIFDLPIVFRLRGQVSLLHLIEETGYLRYREQIDAPLLQTAIRGRHGLIEAWHTYSREKQEDCGWFFEGPDDGCYLVGSQRYSFEGPRQIRDAGEACAYFIKGELESIGGCLAASGGTASKISTT
jgi:hypothetical protein